MKWTEATGPWMYNSPPKDGTYILAIFDGRPLVVGWNKIWHWRENKAWMRPGVEKDTWECRAIHKDPECWARINLPNKLLKNG